jgi:hypothetical protein
MPEAGCLRLCLAGDQKSDHREGLHPGREWLSRCLDGSAIKPGAARPPVLPCGPSLGLLAGLALQTGRRWPIADSTTGHRCAQSVPKSM